MAAPSRQVPSSWHGSRHRSPESIANEIGGFDPDRVEVHEPRLEESPRDCLQRLVHPAVQLDLVVKRAERLHDSALGRSGFGRGEGKEVFSGQAKVGGAGRVRPTVASILWGSQQPVQVVDWNITAPRLQLD